ncbi:MAG: hypothetical protein JWM20_517 [Patescibacteria group bacterium]|nr:hypothetical protein [Patescibacteria group bacterium]
MAQKNTNTANLIKGLGIAGAAAAAIAGGYFFYGKDGAKHRKNLKSWAVKAKAEVLEKLEKAKDMSEENYNMAIDSIADKYSKVKSMDQADVAAFAKDLKKHWKDIKREISPAPAKKAAKKSAKKSK